MNTAVHQFVSIFSEATTVHQDATARIAAERSRFVRDDSGAITIDWVGLSAGIVLAGMVAIFAIFGNGVSVMTANVNSGLTTLVSDLDPGPVVQQNP